MFRRKLVLNQMTVRDGRLVLPSGMSYRLLVLPSGRSMTPALAAKIKDLVSEGATVVGPPPLGSPSLADYPGCDHEVKRIAAEVWGDCDGESLTENRYGKGKVIWGKLLVDVFADMQVPADFACSRSRRERADSLHPPHLGRGRYLFCRQCISRSQ